MSLLLKKPYIIAEIGVNHNGSVSLAKKLIKEAKKAGADAVKFQTFIVDDIADNEVEKANYQKTDLHETQYTMLKRYELNQKEFRILYEYSKKQSIDFLSTACDVKSLHFLANELKIKTIKIASPDLTNLQLLLHAGRSKKNIIISSGMSTTREIDIALSALCYGYSHQDFKFNPIKHKNLYKNYTSYLKNNIKLLHCTTEYPAPLQELNLNVIKLFKKKYPVDIGYSDHSHNLITPIIATTMLASIIEVHITLDNQMDGPDHKSSLNMNMLKKYITNISDTITILGLGEKKITVSESKNSRVVKKYLYYSRDVQKGEILLDDMILCKRSNKGISSTEYHKVLGKPLTISKKGHTRISHNHFMNKI